MTTQPGVGGGAGVSGGGVQPGAGSALGGTAFPINSAPATPPASASIGGGKTPAPIAPAPSPSPVYTGGGHSGGIVFNGGRSYTPNGSFAVGFTAGFAMSESAPVAVEYVPTPNYTPSTFSGASQGSAQTQATNANSTFSAPSSNAGPFASFVSLLQTLVQPLFGAQTSQPTNAYSASGQGVSVSGVRGSPRVSLTGIPSSLLSNGTTLVTLQSPAGAQSPEGLATSSASAGSLGESGVGQVLSPWLQLLSLNTASSTLFAPTTFVSTSTAGGISDAWLFTPQHLSNESSLSQAQADYMWLKAQITAWQNLQNAGLCDQNCQQQLAALQLQLPATQAQIAALTKAVNTPPTAQQAIQMVATGTPSAAGAGAPTAVRLAPSISLYSATTTLVSSTTPLLSSMPEYKSAIAEPLPATTTAPTLMSNAPVRFQVPPPPPPPTQTQQEEGAIVQVLGHVWQTVTQWFAPVSVATSTASSTPSQAHTCSLLTSLFGGCSRP